MIFKDLVAFQTIFLLAACNGKAGKNRRCYVCVPKDGPSVAEVKQMFPDDLSVPACDGFRPEKDYERVCPSMDYAGCLTQTDGFGVTKTCSEVEVQDCKTANKIKYCYCKGDLCNREIVPTLPKQEVPLGDDEDVSTEGSGFASEENPATPRRPDPVEDFETIDGNGLLTTETSTKGNSYSRGKKFRPEKLFIFFLFAYICMLNIQ